MSTTHDHETTSEGQTANRSHQPHSPPTGTDRVRQVIVSVGAVIAVLGAMMGSGVFLGEPMQEAANRAFDTESTPVAPDGPAFSIWSVIYAGLVAYAIWQWFPSQAARTRHRRVGYWILVSMLLNALWLVAVQVELIWLTLVIMAVLLVTLIVAHTILLRHRASGVIDAIISDGTMGLYLGWIIVASIANTAVVLNEYGFEVPLNQIDTWAIVVLAVGAAIGAALAVWNRGRLAPGAAITWGLAWIGVARLQGDLVSEPIAYAAFGAAGVVLVVTIIMRIVYARTRTEVR